jgi:hypothetical protein
MKRDVYHIQVPGDLADTPQELCEHAITEARERARIYAMPANWEAEIEKGEVGDFEVTVKVIRWRN